MVLPFYQIRLLNWTKELGVSLSNSSIGQDAKEGYNTTMNMTRLHVNIEGHVQGVGFRYWAHHTATRLGIIGGYVKNGPDGTVEVEAEADNRLVLEAFFHELQCRPRRRASHQSKS